VNSAIIRQFGMEGGGEDTPLAHHHGPAVACRQNLDAGAEGLKNRRANEHHFEGLALQLRLTEEHVALRLPPVVSAA